MEAFKMPSSPNINNAFPHKAYVITGPTSGIGRRTAFELAKHATVVLVGRDRGRLAEVQKTIERRGQHAVSVVCDLSDLASVRRSVFRLPACSTTRALCRCAPPGTRWVGT
jgi:short-subunit dehydrogenase